MISRKEAAMLLPQETIPQPLQKKVALSRLVLLSLLAQSCGAISDLSQPNESSYSLPHNRDETASNDAARQKVSLEKKRASKSKHALRGEASWYGPGIHGNKTGSGGLYNQNKLTAAHKTLPLGTKARVTNLDNGNTVEVEINDRGPFVQGRIIDLSRAAAGVLDFVESGTVPVTIQVIAHPTGTLLADDNRIQ